MAVYTTWAVIPSGRSKSGRNAAKSVASASPDQSRRRGAPHGCPPWRGRARDMLEHRQNALGQQALGDRARQRGDLVRRLPIGAVADDRVGAGDRHIRDRQAIHVDADARRDRQQSGERRDGRPSCRSRHRGRRCGHKRHRADRPANAAGRGAERGRLPGRRARARRARPPREKMPSGWLTCAGRLDVALEENEPPRLGLAQKRALRGRQGRARNPGDESACRHRRDI